jgi:endonuclease YncB( thermonuclease family)
MTRINRFKLSNGPLGLICFLLLCGATAIASAEQPTISLDITAESGDLLFEGKPTRLYGIHFPVQPGLCNEALNGCRELGLKALAHWLSEAGPVECEILGVSRSGTRIARCRQDQIDLGAWLVGHGFAVADRRGGRGYLRDEQSARVAHVGLWGNDELIARF